MFGTPVPYGKEELPCFDVAVVAAASEVSDDVERPAEDEELELVDAVERSVEDEKIEQTQTQKQAQAQAQNRVKTAKQGLKPTRRT
jgi:hypothetical protein